MSASPRIMRAVVVPTAPRLRRVTGVNTRPFGKFTLFLAATCILGLTSLCYVWQASQRTKAELDMNGLSAQLNTLQNANNALQTTINRLTSPPAIYQAAIKYGMQMPSDNSTIQTIVVPGRTITKYVTIAAAPVTHQAAPVRLATTDAAVTSWWQDAWIVVYKLLR